MEGESQNPTEICGDEEEFYEKIEAPKFVDFTAPDRCSTDDRFWFCLRVGCDRKHEEEIDHEAISKEFVLRVMAARSPNVRLRKLLNRKTYSFNDKCPQSAPAKPTKSRLSKLAVISSISQKTVDTKPEAKQNSKTTSTPKVPKGGKQVAAKYLTTPRHKMCPSNTSNAFRSVQNPKPTNIAVPKNKIVAKSLFQSPKKKGICVKTSAELRTPLTKICEGIKKLEISSQRKRVLGYSTKSSKEIKVKSDCKDKRTATSLLRPSTKEQKTKSLRGLKRKSNNDSDRVLGPMPKGVTENESSDMEIDTKSRTSEKNNTITDLSEGTKVNEGNLEVKSERIPEMKADLGDKHIESENLENDDKENALAPDNNRSCGRNTLGKSETKTIIKVVKTQGRNLKEGLKEAATSAQVVKYKKPKPTNPKPFRLRTDERGVIREANMERRAPLKESEAVSALPTSSDKKNENNIDKQNRPAERSDGDRKLRTKVPTTTTTLQRRCNPLKHQENERRILGEISGKSISEKESPSLQPHFMMPIGGASTRKIKASDVKETSSAEVGKGKNSLRSVSRGKKSKAVEEEPSFQSDHIKKSCPRKVA